MIAAKGYAVQDATAPLQPYSFERRELRDDDVLIDILYCGVCHSDLHQARNEWGGTVYPLVPGHEIVGKISKTGSAVSKFKAGDVVGVGCFVDSCRTCHSCKKGLEQYCENGAVGTYNGREKDGSVTRGGYSNQIVVTQDFVLKVSEKLSLERVAPLLCAGITTYSPLRQWNVKSGDKVGVVGLGGLGHMAVKLAAAMGAEVTVLSTSAKKENDAKELGAHNFAVTTNKSHLKQYGNYFNLIIDTVSAPHDLNLYLQLLDLDGTMVLLGAPPDAPQLMAFNLIMKRRRLAGSLVGGIKETQEMLDFCAQHNIMSDVEVIDIKDINQAYERMLQNDVRYRFVIDMSTL
jgi:alcohol dehydrogenase (NADP+)